MTSGDVVYVLKLYGDKYYIGKTSNLEKRLQDHFMGEGSAWTRIYFPIELVEEYDLENEFMEDFITLKYMKKYGIENVRGGSFCQVVLDDSSLDTLNRMMYSCEDSCFKCGGTGHLISKCPLNKRNYYSRKNNTRSNSKKCYICKRNTHTVEKCYAKTDLYGKIIKINVKRCCRRCGRLSHSRDKCYATFDIFKQRISDIKEEIEEVCQNVAEESVEDVPVVDEEDLIVDGGDLIVNEEDTIVNRGDLIINNEGQFINRGNDDEGNIQIQIFKKTYQLAQHIYSWWSN